MKLLLSWFFLLFLGSAFASDELEKPIVLDLQSNWHDPPHRLILLESLAGENKTLYYPALSQIAAIEQTKGRKLLDKELDEFVFGHSVETGLMTTDQVEYVKFSMELKRYSALIQAYYQYYETEVKPSLEKHGLGLDCENVLVYNGVPTCDAGKVYALETSASSEGIEILPTDRLFVTNRDSPIAILYGDVESESFIVMHSNLLESALNGKIQYILRYKPPANVNELPKETLAGYGVELYVKRTDYLVIDDRADDKDDDDDEETEAKSGKEASSHKLEPSLDSSSIDKKKLQLISLRAATYIMAQPEPFEALKEVSLNFPKYASSLAELEANDDLLQETITNYENQLFAPGQNVILVNGAPITALSDDIFTLVENVDKERNLLTKLSGTLGLDEASVAQLVAKNLVGEALLNNAEIRYDYRNPGLIWLNSLANDPRFASYPRDLESILKPTVPGQLPAVARSIHSIVFVVDLTSVNHLRALANVVSLLSRGLPIEIGVIPLLDTPEALQIARELFCLSTLTEQSAQVYIMRMLNGMDHSSLFNKITASSPEKVDLYSDTIDGRVALTQEWIDKFEISSETPSVFVNGVILDSSSPSWFTIASDIIQSDVDLLKIWIKEGKINEEDNIRDIFIRNGSTYRNNLITPSDPDSMIFMDTEVLWGFNKEQVQSLPYIEKNTTSERPFVTIWSLVDFEQEHSSAQISNLLQFVDKSDVNVRLFVVPIVADDTSASSRQLEAALLQKLYSAFKGDVSKAIDLWNGAIDDEQKPLQTDDYPAHISSTATLFLKSSTDIYKKVGSIPAISLVVGGRIVHLDADHPLLSVDDIDQLLNHELSIRIDSIVSSTLQSHPHSLGSFKNSDKYVSLYTTSYFHSEDSFYYSQFPPRVSTEKWAGIHSSISIGEPQESAVLNIVASLDPVSEKGQSYITVLEALSKLPKVSVRLFLAPKPNNGDQIPLTRFYRPAFKGTIHYSESGYAVPTDVTFHGIPQDTLLVLGLVTPDSWVVTPSISEYDLDNIILNSVSQEALRATYELDHLLLQGHARDLTTGKPPAGLALQLDSGTEKDITDTIVMANLGYLQLKSNPGIWNLAIKEGRSSEIFKIESTGMSGYNVADRADRVWISKMTGATIYPRFRRKGGMENANVLEPSAASSGSAFWKSFLKPGEDSTPKRQADINIFSVASGHLYERFLSIMTASVMNHTEHTVKFWFIENFLSPSFKQFLPALAERYGFDYELVTYKWPSWLRGQTEKQRTIWGYKILFLDVLFPQSLNKVIFVDADQIVRTDLYELVEMDLQGAPYGYTPMGDSREEMEGFRFWKQGYWKTFLKDKPYHISALYVIDLVKFREIGAGDRLRQTYQQLSQDPNSLSNLDQDLPNHMQHTIPIFSLPQDWLWCETWCSDESLLTAKTIDLCNNPLTKEPKLDRARRQIPEWTQYDNEVASLRKLVDSVRESKSKSVVAEPISVKSSVPKEEHAPEHDEL